MLTFREPIRSRPRLLVSEIGKFRAGAKLTRPSQIETLSRQYFASNDASTAKASDETIPNPE
jgi:hypothetical protein